jgi:hypothetical protein
MESSPSRETVSCTATQELSSILWNQKVHYRFHNSPLLVLILNQTNPLQTTTSCLSKIHLDIIHPPIWYALVFLVTYFLLGFPSIPYMHSASLSCVLHALPISFNITVKMRSLEARDFIFIIFIRYNNTSTMY